MSDLVYGKMEYKMAAIIEEIAARHATGQPILVGTISIEVSEYLSRLLKRKGIPHEVLNAKHHEREAEIIAQAGRYGAVTIATNMAGRGTDIMLGGNVEFVLRKELRKAGFDEEIIGFALSPFDYDDPQVREAKKQMEKIRPSIEAEVHEEAQKVRAVGGLHVLGTERHEARRIDLQLRGRSGRQGDPGSSQFFLSLDDDLLRIFMKEGVANMLHNLGMKEGIPIEHPQLNKVIENAQKRVESAHYGTRRYVLQYDQVMNEQRKFIYAERNRVLENTSLKDHMMTMMKEQIEMATDHYLQGEEPAQERAELFSFLKSLHLPVVQSDEEDKEALASLLVKRAQDFYEKKEAEFGEEIMRELERSILLQVVDRHWMDHIDAMDNLRRGIGLQAIGQIDPVQAYQREGFDMYTQMIESINRETLKYLFGVRISKEPAARRGFEQMATGQMRSTPAEPRKVERKIGRNEPCPCGSGKKYKYCHGRN
jgi:preprotein translocase subunit SecA